jgi:hypothetical protein
VESFRRPAIWLLLLFPIVVPLWSSGVPSSIPSIDRRWGDCIVDISIIDVGELSSYFDSLLERLWFGIGLSIVLYDFIDGVNRDIDGSPKCPVKQAKIIFSRYLLKQLHLTCIFYSLKVDWHHLNHSIWFIERLQRLRHPWLLFAVGVGVDLIVVESDG